MKKIKWTIMTLAIVLSIGGAFATRPHFDCRTAPQYMWNGFQYVLAGTEGVDYFCQGASGTCTYIYNSATQTYEPCQVGLYDPIPNYKKAR